VDAFAALGDNSRRRIFDALAAREQSVGELVARFSFSQPAVSQHLRVLRDARLVRVRPVGQRRLYSVDPDGVRVVELWLERTRRHIAGQLDALDRYLQKGNEPDHDD
jgi:DNA-binding transcriptional ArsR family regulator